MTRMSGAGGGLSAMALARVGAPVPAIESASSANLFAWAAARSKLRAGTGDVARIAFVGDSKTMGAGSGTGAQSTVGAFARSRPARVAALLAAGGLPVRRDGFFGTAGLGTIADVLAYDPRRSGFSGWGGGNVSLGGAALSTGNANPGNFQPGGAIDRCSVLFRDGSDRPAFTVAKGAETITVTPAGAAGGFRRQEIVFATKDASPIIVTRTGTTNSLHLTGLIAWDSAQPGVEIANLGVYGVTAAYHADATGPASPLSALGTYAPHLTIVNLGTNDLNQSIAMTIWLANVRAIATVARTSGSVILTWPGIAGNAPSFGADTVRAQWRTALRGLAAELGCLFVDEETLLGGRAAAQASGAFVDGVHETAWAYDLQASAIARAIL